MGDPAQELIDQLLEFRKRREWEQFHDPKNLAEAISIESGELLENFLWKTTDESKNLSEDEISQVQEEVADIFIFLVYLSEAVGIDLIETAKRKIELNELKYPVEKARGSSKKYSELA